MACLKFRLWVWSCFLALLLPCEMSSMPRADLMKARFVCAPMDRSRFKVRTMMSCALLPSSQPQIALSVMLSLPAWHVDASSSFHCTPASIIKGKRAWLRCFPQHLVWLKERHPESWKRVDKKAQSQPAHLLTAEMFNVVQGQVDASCKWHQELIKKILM